MPLHDGAPAKVKQCVYNDWYKFYECTITTCKNHTLALNSRCLAVDRKAPEGMKVISDEELRLYKFCGEKITTRGVSAKRKEATDRVKNILLLREFILHIEREFRVGGEQPVFTLKALLKRESVYPLKLKELAFENWMWEHLLDLATFNSFKKQKRVVDGDALTIRDLLGMKEQKWALFTQRVSKVFDLTATTA